MPPHLHVFPIEPRLSTQRLHHLIQQLPSQLSCVIPAFLVGAARGISFACANIRGDATVPIITRQNTALFIQTPSANQHSAAIHVEDLARHKARQRRA